MEFKVEYARNGLIVIDDQGLKNVFQENDCDEVDNWAEFLWWLTDTYGPNMGKYSEKRVYINVFPGWDHDNFYSGEECPLCWQKIKDEQL